MRLLVSSTFSVQKTSRSDVFHYVLVNTKEKSTALNQCDLFFTTNHDIMGTVIYKVHLSNEKVLNKNGAIRTAKKGQKQVADIQCNALTSLIHFVQFYSKVNQGCKCIALEVSDLFLSFCNSPNCPVFVKNFFITCILNRRENYISSHFYLRWEKW